MFSSCFWYLTLVLIDVALLILLSLCMILGLVTADLEGLIT